MDIVVHDFAGHPFQAELSRHLAAQGHTVRHLSAAQYVSGKGHLDRMDDDPDGLSFVPIQVAAPLVKYAWRARLGFEFAYARAWRSYINEHPADVVMVANMPLFTMPLFVWTAWRRRQPWVLWHQDVLSRGLGAHAMRKLPRPVGRCAATFADRLERWYARRATRIVAIGEAFTETYRRWKVPSSAVSVIENWAPLNRIRPGSRSNPLSSRMFAADDSVRLMYTGTIGLKHNPGLLVEILQAAIDQGVDVQMTVVSEGEAADLLARTATERPELPLRVVPFVSADDLPDTVAGADVLVALLEPDAGGYSIPSKVLSYLAAGRPILGLIPAANPAARDIAAVGGYVAEPTTEGARGAAAWLAELTADRDRVVELGDRARALAEKRFDLADIGPRFEAVLNAAGGRA